MQIRVKKSEREFEASGRRYHHSWSCNARLVVAFENIHSTFDINGFHLGDGEDAIEYKCIAMPLTFGPRNLRPEKFERIVFVHERVSGSRYRPFVRV